MAEPCDRQDVRGNRHPSAVRCGRAEYSLDRAPPTRLPTGSGWVVQVLWAWLAPLGARTAIKRPSGRLRSRGRRRRAPAVRSEKGPRGPRGFRWPKGARGSRLELVLRARSSLVRAALEPRSSSAWWTPNAEGLGPDAELVGRPSDGAMLAAPLERLVTALMALPFRLQAPIRPVAGNPRQQNAVGTRGVG